MGEFNKQQYDNEYAKKNYDRCIFNVAKGQKKEIQAHYEKKGYKSLNQYINDLIRKDMNENNKTIQTGDIKIEQSGNGKQNINIG